MKDLAGYRGIAHLKTYNVSIEASVDDFKFVITNIRFLNNVTIMYDQLI